MRKNKVNRKGMSLLYSTYEINGLNLDRFINTLKTKGIELKNVKKKNNKQLLVSIKFADNEKFFAIAKELCYNIKKVGVGGKVYPFFALYKNIGVALGTLLMLLIAIFFSDYIFSIDFVGSGSVCKREIKEYLYSNGICEFSKFSDIDLSVLEDKILSSNDNLSFVGVKKRGNRLIIESVLSTEKTKTLNGDIYALHSDCDGVVENIKVYRGTAVVEKGQEVKKGDLLVDGYSTVKEQTVKINVLAFITVICSDDCVYQSKNTGEEEKAILFAKAEFIDREIIDYNVKTVNVGDTYIYTVSVRFKHVIIAG